MAAPTIETTRLRALDLPARRRRIVAAYKRAGSHHLTAVELGIPPRTLSRLIKDDPALSSELESIRLKRNGSS